MFGTASERCSPIVVCLMDGFTGPPVSFPRSMHLSHVLIG
jgi:hypothetical protein